MDLISGQKVHTSSQWTFDSSKNVLFKEERHYRYLKLIFLIFGLVIAYPIYIIFSGISIYGYSLPIGIILIIFLGFWINGMPELIINFNLQIPFLSNKITRKEINPAEGKYIELHIGTDKKSKTVKNEKYSKCDFFIRENTHNEDPTYVRRGDVEMVERISDGHWIGPKFQKIVFSNTVFLQLDNKSIIDLATVETIPEAREVIFSFKEIINRISPERNLWREDNKIQSRR